MKPIKQEHIDALSRGKKSGINIGSRMVQHHLYKYEQAEYERALKRWYLIVEKKSRPNLENLWLLVCESKNMEYLVLQKNGEETQIFSHDNVIFSGSLSDAKKYIETIF